MPAAYAHYRFGKLLIPQLPSEVRQCVQRFRRLYDVGLQGPDIFFYHNILVDDSMKKLAQKLHSMSGREFFTMACRRLRLEPTEAGQAYLYGLLAHYCLDSVCHPLIQATAAEGAIGHIELETEFDRYLLTLDGKESPETFDISQHMKLTKGECVTVAGLYPSVSPGNVLQSIQTMAAVTKLLATPGRKGRRRRTKARHCFCDRFLPAAAQRRKQRHRYHRLRK